MKTMLKKFIMFFVVFGLSFGVQKLGLMDQGKAFFIIQIIVLIATIMLVIAKDFKSNERSAGKSIAAIIIFAVIIGLNVLFTFIGSELFKVDFYTVYQIMTFGQCFVNNNDDKK